MRIRGFFIVFSFLKIGKNGPKKPLPDNVTISEPKAESEVTKPYSEVKGKPLETQTSQQPGLPQQQLA